MKSNTRALLKALSINAVAACCVFAACHSIHKNGGQPNDASPNEADTNAEGQDDGGDDSSSTDSDPQEDAGKDSDPQGDAGKDSSPDSGMNLIDGQVHVLKGEGNGHFVPQGVLDLKAHTGDEWFINIYPLYYKAASEEVFAIVSRQHIIVIKVDDSYSLDHTRTLETPLLREDLSYGEEDLSGDGVVDLIVRENNSSRFLFFESDESEFLKPAPNLLDEDGSSLSVRHWTTGDFNHDGVGEVVLLTGGDLLIHLSYDGAEWRRTEMPLEDSCENGLLSAFDIDADGFLDLTITNAFAESCSIYFAQDALRFPSQASVIVERDPRVCEAVHNHHPLHDMDRDGSLDLLYQYTIAGSWECLTNYDSGHIAYGDGTGEFALEEFELWEPLFEVDRTGALAIGDVNMDGFADVVTISKDGIEAHVSKGPRAYDDAVVSLDHAWPRYVHAAHLMDLDGDGINDLIALTQ
ncbi:MAG: VCBS repeat-containing protein [Deltaproteobacteria bacterium]|nr:VCBS repeat-containing protein [Deltaproteobacteria bacterium]